MIFDKEALFSDAQAITVTAPSTNYYDKKVSKVFFGRGIPILLFCQVVTTFTAGGAGTLTVALQSDDDPAFGSPTALVTTAALALAALEAGMYIPLINGFPFHGKDDTERYVRLNYTVATGPMLTGAVTAGLVLGNNLQSRNWL